MSLYTDGTQAANRLPKATVVPGVVDPTLTKLEDVQVPYGKPINMQDYAANPAEPMLVQKQVGVQLQQKPQLSLGDNIHFDMSAGKPIQPKTKSEFQTIPSTTLTTDDRFIRS